LRGEGMVDRFIALINEYVESHYPAAPVSIND
jgi:hypothetical protein